MRPFGVVSFLIFGFILVSAPLARAVEEGQLVKRDGKWAIRIHRRPGPQVPLPQGHHHPAGVREGVESHRGEGIRSETELQC